MKCHFSVLLGTPIVSTPGILLLHDCQKLTCRDYRWSFSARGRRSFSWGL